MRVLPKANDPCWCGSGQKYKRCHKRSGDPVKAGTQTPLRPVPDSIEKPIWGRGGTVERWDEPNIKSPEILSAMRQVCVEAADVLRYLGTLVRPGVTTEEIDAACHSEILRRGAYPSPLLYPGGDNPFPKSLCTSVNEVICHGIPDDRELADGDIVNFDVTLFKHGVHGDTNATFTVGRVDPLSQQLIEVTRHATMRGISAVRAGAPMNAVGRAIADYAESFGFGVIRDFVGHGIGEQFHTDLQVCHYYHPGLTDPLEPGMVFTIEPMISVGDWRARLWDDDWTASTRDRSRTAQFEHTILVTEGEPEILTTPSETEGHPFWDLATAEP